MKNKFFILVFALVFASCVKDKPSPPVQPPGLISNSKRVYVVNEGPFQSGGNGSISLYDSGTNEVIENFYEVQNNSPLGNIAQSLNFINGNYYIVVNNAGKITVCDKQLKKTKEITGFTSPRYILQLTNQKAYVSDLYAHALSIVDLAAGVITGTISCPGKTEKMVLFYNKVFVTNSDRDYVYVVNSLTDKIEDSIFVARGAASIVMDRYDKLWVLASGSVSASSARLTKFDPVTNTVELFQDFKLADSPFNLCLNAGKDTLFFINGSVYRMDIKETLLPQNAFIANDTKNFYGLGVNPNDHTIYVSDAMDYSQRSQIYIYTAKGSPKYNFKAGIIANSFYFE